MALKVIDLRPLRLRERFNPARLKREVDIMRRLKHPNIIQFVEVYEDVDHLMMVMEYCPGKELFDVILARKHFREDDARPIFAQVARALFYLHSLNIIHRDVKPENVLIMDTPDANGALIAKLLDFGLSKNANGGSAAKTFVGTPCYLAPEVEYTSKGLGGTYGLPADCWSLGAVLYVMLVARFPEFEQDAHGKVVVKLPPVLWNNISSEAKDLIRALMNTNPAARLSMHGVLQHPWMGKYMASGDELVRVHQATTDLSHHLQAEEELIVAQEQMTNLSLPNQGHEMTPMGTVVHHHAMILRQAEDPAFGPEQLRLAPLLHLQRSIATCFEEAHSHYHLLPEVATQVRRGAVLCRQQLVESTKMLRKVEQTASEVLGMFPDLEMAVEEEEPQLAASFFNLVKVWVAELRELVGTTQKINKASMSQIQKVVEQSTIGLKRQEQQEQPTIKLPKGLLENILHAKKMGEDGVPLDANQVMELFMTLFQSTTQGQKVKEALAMDTDSASSPRETKENDLADIFQRAPVASPPTSTDPSTFEEDAPMDLQVPSLEVLEEEDLYSASSGESSPRAAARLSEALQKLRQVDMILEQLGIFWANTEVVLDLLTKKGQHVEQFIGFSSKPRLMARFRERMDEYKRFWEGVRMMCSNYVEGVKMYDNDRKMYGFLEQTAAACNSGADSMEKADSQESLNSSFFGDHRIGSPPHIVEMAERVRR